MSSIPSKHRPRHSICTGISEITVTCSNPAAESEFTGVLPIHREIVRQLTAVAIRLGLGADVKTEVVA